MNNDMDVSEIEKSFGSKTVKQGKKDGYSTITSGHKKWNVWNGFTMGSECVILMGYNGSGADEEAIKKHPNQIRMFFNSYNDIHTGTTPSLVFHSHSMTLKIKIVDAMLSEENIRIFKEYYTPTGDSVLREIIWCAEINNAFDLEFFKIGHAYSIIIDDQYVTCLLSNIHVDYLTFYMIDHTLDKYTGLGKHWTLRDTEYLALSKEERRIHYISLCGDKWSNDKEEL